MMVSEVVFVISREGVELFHHESLNNRVPRLSSACKAILSEVFCNLIKWLQNTAPSFQISFILALFRRRIFMNPTS